MKKQRNQFQLKDQENSPERTMTDIFRLIDTDLKMEIMKILKELSRLSTEMQNIVKRN